MFRMRRYRVFIIFAVIAIGALYHFTSLGELESAGAASVEGLKNFGQKVESSVPPTRSKPDVKDIPDSRVLNTPISLSGLADLGAAKPSQASTVIKESDESSKYGEASAIASKASANVHQPSPPSDSAAIAEASAIDEHDLLNPKARPAGKPAPPIGSTSTNKTSKPHTGPAEPLVDGGGGRLEILADTNIPKIHWSQMPEHFPVPTSLLIQLPTGKPMTIPKIQHDFAPETEDEKVAREKKRDIIKAAFSFSWAGYKKKAWMQDELTPVSGKYRNPFCAWGATLVDSLDTLYMMDLKDEFEEAVEAVKDIDFTTSPRNDIPLFETVIRYLGGLIGAYDISGGTHRILLDKAVELADILMGAFDTPNRMPMTFYYWKPTFASQPHRAKPRVVLAELGSLSVEFTRLAQITKENRYYDAIARITNEFEIWQNDTRMPGLWPMQVDASGCKKPPAGSTTSGVQDPLIAPPLQERSSQKAVSGDTRKSNSMDSTTAGEIAQVSSHQSVGAAAHDIPNENARDLSVADPQGASVGATEHPPSKIPRGDVMKRQINDGTRLDPQPTTISKAPECEPQGLASPPYTASEEFGIGGQADSTYEYLPKEFMLLGGLNEQYRTIYEAAADTITAKLLYRAMIPDNKRRIMHPGLARVSDKTNAVDFISEGSHLGCFAGGMYAVGAKIFGRKEDMKIARELTDGCVWAYESTTTGIMPEVFQLVACRDPADCPWDETYYHEKLDPYRDSREKTRLSQLAENQVPLAAGKGAKEAASTIVPAPVQSASPPGSLGVQPVGSKAEGEVAPAESGMGKLTPQPKQNAVGKPEPPAAEQSAEQPMSLPVGGANVEQPASPPSVAKKPTKSRLKRQLGDIAPSAAAMPVKPSNDDTRAPETQTSKELAADKAPVGASPAIQHSLAPLSNSATNGTIDAAHILPASPDRNPTTPTHEEFVQARIKNEKLPKGITKVNGIRYLLRPEAIESVFIMFRATGDTYWREKGWEMYKAVEKHTNATFGASAIDDVTSEKPKAVDEMESFWLAETLKYFYLLFSEPSLVSLDDYVLNTEAHPFKRPK